MVGGEVTISQIFAYFASQGPWAVVAVIVGKMLLKKYDEAEKRALSREQKLLEEAEERERHIEQRAAERERELMKKNEERERNYQHIIDKLTDKYDIVIDKLHSIESHLELKKRDQHKR